MHDNEIKKMAEEKLLSFENVQNEYRKLTLFLIKNNLSITTMESCTSGFIASLITDTEGSSSIFKGAFVTYSNDVKILNGVEKNVIQDFGVYSKETAIAMAEACVNKIQSNIGIGITGTFGNLDPFNKDSKEGKVFFAIKVNKKVNIIELTLPKNISRFESKVFVADKVFKRLCVELEINNDN